MKLSVFDTSRPWVDLPEGMTIGSDPEFMLFDISANMYVSALDVLKNDKYSPIDLGNGIMMYADNVLVEFSFPPSNTVTGFIDTMRIAILAGAERLNRYGPLVLHPIASMDFHESQLQNPKAKEAGCSPNFDAWGSCVNMPPNLTGNRRTGSFHIHVGHPTLDTKPRKERMIKLLDRYLGMASVLADKDPSSILRRKLYGKAGEFRPTPYGIEYRVLGPYFLRKPALVAGCMELMVMAFNAMDIPEPDELTIQGVDIETIKRCINQGNEEYAKESMVLVHSHHPNAAAMYNNWQ